jgi:hypothetical protein
MLHRQITDGYTRQVPCRRHRDTTLTGRPSPDPSGQDRAGKVLMAWHGMHASGSVACLALPCLALPLSFRVEVVLYVVGWSAMTGKSSRVTLSSG